MLGCLSEHMMAHSSLNSWMDCSESLEARICLTATVVPLNIAVYTSPAPPAPILFCNKISYIHQIDFAGKLNKDTVSGDVGLLAVGNIFDERAMLMSVPHEHRHCEDQNKAYYCWDQGFDEDAVVASVSSTRQSIMLLFCATDVSDV